MHICVIGPQWVNVITRRLWCYWSTYLIIFVMALLHKQNHNPMGPTSMCNDGNDIVMIIVSETAFMCQMALYDFDTIPVSNCIKQVGILSLKLFNIYVDVLIINHLYYWVSCQMRRIAGCAYGGNAGNVFSRHRGLAIPACIPALAWPLYDKKAFVSTCRDVC